MDYLKFKVAWIVENKDISSFNFKHVSWCGDSCDKFGLAIRWATSDFGGVTWTYRCTNNLKTTNRPSVRSFNFALLFVCILQATLGDKRCYQIYNNFMQNPRSESHFKYVFNISIQQMFWCWGYRVHGQHDGFHLVAKPCFSGSGALVQIADDITVVFIDIHIEFF